MTLAMAKALSLHQLATTEQRAANPELPRQLADYRRSLTDDNWPKKVLAFMQLFGQHLNSQPAPLDAVTQALELDLIAEEHKELIQAVKDNNLIEILDGGIDLIYVTLHLLLAHGFSPLQLLLAMEEVHASNMTKTDDEGKPAINGISPGYRDDEPLYNPHQPLGKALKGPNYTPVDLDAAIRLT